MSRKYQWKKSMAGLMASAMVATTVLGSVAPAYAQSFDRNASEEVSDREKASMAVAKKAAEEGMVLLKNKNNTLPIAKSSKVALFGAGAYYSITGGTGSGDVNQRDSETVSVYEGLKKAYTITSSSWVDHYGDLFEESKAAGDQGVCTSSGSVGLYSYFPNEISIEDKYIESAKADTDTAVFVITRNSGEGADRTTTAGDYYLSELEKENLKKVTDAFAHVVVVLNVGGVMDMEYLESAEHVDSIFLMSQAGMKQGEALADILDGEVSPSGKLVDTWAKKYEDYATSDNFNKSKAAENYEEGIYVGYRYFDTFNVAPRYEFGYGLSYTDFEITTDSVTADKDNVTVKATVTNKGNKYSGKEVVEIYFSSPDNASVDKPYQELAAYGKTDELAPGECQTLTIKFKTSDMSYYSEDKAAYVLDKGDYVIRVGNSSRNTHVAAKVNIDKEYITEQLSTQHMGKDDNDSIDDKLAGKALKETGFSYDGEAAEISAASTVNVSGIKTVNNASEYDDETAVTYIDKENKSYSANALNEVVDYEEKVEKVSTVDKPNLKDVYEGKTSMEQFVASLPTDVLADVVNGTGMQGFTAGWKPGEKSNDVAGAAGQTVDLEDEYGISATVLSDGPAGLRLSQTYTTDEEKTYHQYCTAFPIGTCLAQMWNTDLMEEVGEAVGQEMVEYGVTVWLAPGMNIHRNPLCGRNFEYYSEDPFLTGTMGSAITIGVQSNPGVGTEIKHYTTNNRENERNSEDNRVSERAMREIYLKGFEIAVKTAQPMALMTCYNKINGTFGAGNYDTVTDMLRGEWGFKGLVTTDWFSQETAPNILHAGNDMIQPGYNNEDVLSAVEDVAPTFSENGYIGKKMSMSGFAWFFGGTPVDAWGDFKVVSDNSIPAEDKTVVSTEFDALSKLAAGTEVTETTEGFDELPKVMQDLIKAGDGLKVTAVDADTWKAEYSGIYEDNNCLYLGDLQRSATRVFNMIMASNQFADYAGFDQKAYGTRYELENVQAVSKDKKAVSTVSDNKPATETVTTIVGSDGNTYVITTPTNLPFSGRKFKIGGKKGLKVTVSVNGVKYVVKSAKLKDNKAVGKATFTIKKLDTKKDASGNKVPDKAKAKAASKVIKGTELSFDIVAAELTKDNVTLKMKGDTIKKVTATLKDNNGKEKKYKLKSGTDYELVSDNKVLSFKGNYKGTLAVDQATKK